MNGEESIQFAEASQAFLCDEYYKNNFTAFLHANSIIVESSQRPEITGVLRCPRFQEAICSEADGSRRLYSKKSAMR